MEQKTAGLLFWKKKCLEVWFEGIQTDVSVGQDGEGHSIQKGWRRKRCRNQQWRGWHDEAGGWEDQRQSGEYRKVCKVAANIETIHCHGRLSQKQKLSAVTTRLTTVNTGTICRTTSLTTVFTTANTGTICCTISLSKYWHHQLYHQPYCSKYWHHTLLCKDKHCWRRTTKRQGGSAYGGVVAWQCQLWSTHCPLTAPAVASQGQ